MNSLYARQPPLSARFVASARNRVWSNRSGNSSTVSLTSSPNEKWDSIGVTNMCFKSDESDDVACVSQISPQSLNTNPISREQPSNDTSNDSGYSDVTSPLTSPDIPSANSDETMEIYHRAMSRRRTLADSDSPQKYGELYGRQMALTSSPNFSDSFLDYCFPVDTSAHAVPLSSESSSNMTSSSYVRRQTPHEKTSRSWSLMEADPQRILPPKPRSFSQQHASDVPSVLYTTLHDISEEKVVIDGRGISRVRRRGRQKNSPSSSDSDSGGYDIRCPLLDDSSDSMMDSNLNEWQVKLGEKEPEKCRCDDKQPPPPPPKPLPPAPPSESSSEYLTGLQTSIGDSLPMSAAESLAEVEGIETEIGTSREMSEISQSANLAASSGSDYTYNAGVSSATPQSGKRNKKSIKNIFRLGFLTTKSKKKSKDEITPHPDTGPRPSSPSKRVSQRRMSRLEMNEPIEDIFSGVKFETIQKRPSSPNNGEKDNSDETDDDIIEDPEVIMRSIMKSDKGNSFLKDTGDAKCIPEQANDVINENHGVVTPGNLEKELLLPIEEGEAPPDVESSNKTSEEDLR